MVKIDVCVAYATVERQVEKVISVNKDSCVYSIILQSGILTEFNDIDLAHNTVGIDSRVVALKDYVVDGERIEIYRPLALSPMEARRLRVKRQAAR